MIRFSVLIFLGAFLLFGIQPMMGKFILPWFGGTPAVWTTCMLFFQVMLVLGYAYAHGLIRYTSPKRQATIHLFLLVLSLLLLPITPSAGWKPLGEEEPIGRILLMLFVNVGFPYFLLASTAPLTQAWFFNAYPNASPYRLYALSNIGSLLGLLSYPFVVEPNLPVSTQTVWWSIAYAGFALLSGLVALSIRSRPAHLAAELDAGPGGRPSGEDSPRKEASLTRIPLARRWPYWLALPACGSAIFLGATNQICVDVAVVPFLWIVPLSLYLVTFILCFESDAWYARRFYVLFALVSLPVAGFIVLRVTGIPISASWVFHGALIAFGLISLLLLDFIASYFQGTRRRVWEPRRASGTLLAVTLVLIGYTMFTYGNQMERMIHASHNIFLQFGVFLYVTFVGCMICHGELARLRPPPKYLTSFYLAMSVGGALGGVLVGVVGPLVFSGYWELPLALVLVALLLVSLSLEEWRRWWIPPVSVALATIVALAAYQDFLFPKIEGLVTSSRNFFGTLGVHDRIEVIENQPDVYRSLIHGRIFHGAQLLAEGNRRRPISYYSPDTGVALAIHLHPRRGEGGDKPLRIAVTGLGAGGIAAHARSGDVLRFYEINPRVVDYAYGDQAYFSFLDDAEKLGGATVEKPIVGDARLRMEAAVAEKDPHDLDVLVLDAFSSDAVPFHLLTAECFEIYRRHLREDGILAVNFTNAYIDLRPILWGVADRWGWHAIEIHSGGDEKLIVSPADWMLLTPNDKFVQNPEIQARARPRPTDAKVLHWTDESNNLLELLRFP